MSTVVTRFAPSPTGYLHVGGARTALFNWLLARHTGGRFLLRIEDTDLARSTQQACDQLLEDLKWLGLQWDNPQLVYQSKRLDTYNRVIADLISRGLAYKAYETLEELDNQRRQAEREKRPFIYRRPKLTDEQIRQFESEGRPSVVRFVMPVKEYRFDDAVLGPNQGVAANQVQDFVIRKSDGMPTYHFAVVVDDSEMKITHVLRGQEHLLNTVNHIALQEALGYSRPVYGHLPIILNVDGSKMGKRDRDRKIREYTTQKRPLWFKNTKPEPAPIQFSEVMREFVATKRSQLVATGRVTHDLIEARLVDPTIYGEWLVDRSRQLGMIDQFLVMEFTGLQESDLPEVLVHDFRRTGYLPEVLLNFIALLGWNAGEDRERMTVDEMVRLFSLDRVGRSNSRFDRTKLLAFNTEACAEASEERILLAMRDYLVVNPESPLNRASDAEIAELLRMKRGFRLLRDVDESSRFFFVSDDEISYDSEAALKVMRQGHGQAIQTLRDICELLSGLPTWEVSEIEAVLKGYCDKHGLTLGKVAQPIRVAISGTTVSPPIFESLRFFGKTRTLRRIERCIAHFFIASGNGGAPGVEGGNGRD